MNPNFGRWIFAGMHLAALACGSRPNSTANGAHNVSPAQGSSSGPAPEQPASFQILGITGHGDSTADASFTGDREPAVAWTASAHHAAYEVTVRDANGTVRCPAATVDAALLKMVFTSCRGGFRPQTAYTVQVDVLDVLGVRTGALNSPYAFTVDPTPNDAATSMAGSPAPTVANGLDIATVTITLRNAGGFPLESVIPTFSASGAWESARLGACSPSNTQGVSMCTVASTVAETKTLALVTPVTQAGDVLRFVAGPPAHMHWTSPAPAGAWLNVCSPALRLAFTDATGNSVALPEPLDLGLGSMGTGAGTFFADAACTTPPITALHLPAGASGAAFYVRQNTLGTLAVVVEGTAMLGTATVDVATTEVPPGHWRTMSQVNAPTPRDGATATWTGNVLVVWGGVDFPMSHPQPLGAQYNPVLDVWTPMPLQGSPQAVAHARAVWASTTHEVLVWGIPSSGYNPESNTWSPLSNQGAPSARSPACAVWSGTEMIIWGGSDEGPGAPLADGARYNPATDTWTPMAPTPVGLVARLDASCVWTGDEMVVWGGDDGYSSYLDTGGRYRPDANAWRMLPSQGSPSPRWLQGAVWTGTEMLIWGGTDLQGNMLATGAAYSPSRNTWTTLDSRGAPPAREGPVAVWSGSHMLVWGGQGFQSDDPNEPGFVYSPETRTWAPLPAGDSPVLHAGNAWAWTGTQLFIWGGSEASNWSVLVNSGAYFTPGP